MTTKREAAISKIADMMANIDFCMLTTQMVDGGLRSRPMSNNGEVEFDGDVWFFSGADTRKVEEIEADSSVQISYADTENFVFISMAGEAEIVTDASKKKELWMDELSRWFEDGPESDDVVLIKVTPSVVEYWSGNGDGEISFE